MTVAVSGESITFNDNSVQATAPKVGMVNRIINGAMVIDQRNAGAAQTITVAGGNTYTVDRWFAITSGASITGQRVAGSGSNQYNYRFTGAASVTGITFVQRIESNNCYDLSGQTATLSLSLANSVLTTVNWTVIYAGATDSWGGANTTIASGSFTVNSTLTNFSTQISIPAAATTGLQVVFSVGAQTSGTWTIGQVQLEKGSTATSFDYRPYGTELGLCQRYYTKLTSFVATGLLGVGITSGVTSSWVSITSPVAFRASPTVSYSALAISDQASYSCSVSSIAATSQTLTGGGIAFNHAGGATLYRTAVVNTTTSAGYIDFSAEL